MNRIILTIAIVTCALTVSAQSADFNIDKIVKALNEKDDAYLLLIKADSARIGDLPYEASAPVLKEVLRNYNGIASYNIAGIDTIGAFFKVRLEAVYQSGRNGKPAFVFDKNGKWVMLDIIRVRKEVDPLVVQQQSLTAVNFPDRIYTKFVLESGLIYVPVHVGDKEGYLMMDSGAPMVILYKGSIPDDKIATNQTASMQGIGGGFKSNGISKISVSFGGLRIDSLAAPVTEIAQAEQIQGKNVFGLLGYELLRHYAVIVNYQTQELLLVKREKSQKAAGTLKIGDKVYQELEEIPFIMQRHIAIIPLSIDAQSYSFGLDCGANANLLKNTLLPKIQSHFDAENTEVNVNGMGDQSGKGSVGYVTGAYAGKLQLDDMYTVFSNQQIGAGTGQDALQIEGLLGTPFLNLHVTEVDYINQRLIFYKQ